MIEVEVGLLLSEAGSYIRPNVTTGLGHWALMWGMAHNTGLKWAMKSLQLHTCNVFGYFNV